MASIGYEHTVFISTVILDRTPTWIEIATFISLCGIAAYAGIKVIARSNQFLIPLAVLLLALPFFLALYDTNAELLMPVFGEDFMQILKGAVLPSGWMGQFLFLGWLLPYLNRPEKARKAAFIALGAVALLMIVINLLTVATFGPMTHKLSYSFLRVIQYIGEFTPFERMESIVVALWTMGFFVKGAVLAFTFCLSVSQLLRLTDYRRLIIPITLISMIGSAWIFKTTAEWQTWIMFGYAFLAFFTHIVLPLLLLIVDSIKQAIRQR